MRRIRSRSLLAGLLMMCGGCAASAGARPGRPDAATDEWRALVGCWRMTNEQFVLDTVPETEHYREPGVRRARFAPPAIVGAYWFIDEKGKVWVARHDGLWGRSYEFTARGDSLVGRSWVGTDVPDARPAPTPATAVRTQSCPPPPAAG